MDAELQTNETPAGGNPTFDISHYTSLVLRYRWLILLPFCLALLAGILLALNLPKLYESKTLILVEPQKVPSEYVKSIVSSDINSRIATISQQIMSRTNLERIIKEFGLFSEPKYKKMYLEDKIKVMRKRITVDVDKNNRRSKVTDAFSVSYRGSDPQRVQQITNTLASYFINQNLRVMESDAIGTKGFLTDELARIRKRLEAVEANLKRYRRKYMGELPEQLESNLRMLQDLQQQMIQKQELFRDDKNRLAMLENQIQIARQETANLSSAPQKAGGEPTTLEGLKRLLEDYRARYTPNHPDVIRLERKIREMEKQSRNAQGLAAAAEQKTGAATAAKPIVSKEIAQLMVEHEAMQREIETKKQEMAQLQSQIKLYRQRVENTPKREQELLTLRRDYNDIKKMYNSMQERKLEADIAVNMEKKQKGEQFRILDPANKPQKPVSPDMKKLFLLCVVLGLGIGAGTVFLIDFFDHSLSQPEEAEKVLKLPVLATIPHVVQTKDRVLKQLNLAATIIGLLFTVGLLAGFAAVSVLNYGPAIRIVSQYAKFS